MGYKNPTPKRKSFRFNRIITCDRGVGVAVLPSIILDVNVTNITTFGQKNVAKSNCIDNTAPNADVCVQNDTRAIIMDTCLFALLNP
ncbi:DUF3172 domain-containing protein [Nostoc sp.]|uniref:DUF3172 domain-containing protein n=1 Tax=Nostoc sp. TaxID=1180 RepID=UPI002FF729F4